MAFYVILTAFLFQRGSAESRDPGRGGRGDSRRAARPCERFVNFLHAYSRGIALAGLLMASFVLHLWGSYRSAVAEAALHGGSQHSLVDHLGDVGFWFESFQNWQSEFLATAALSFSPRSGFEARLSRSMWTRAMPKPGARPWSLLGQSLRHIGRSVPATARSPRLNRFRPGNQSSACPCRTPATLRAGLSGVEGDA